MKINTLKKIKHIIIVVFIVIILSNIFTCPSFATEIADNLIDTVDKIDVDSGVLGVLFEPILKFVKSIGDIAMQGINLVVYQETIDFSDIETATDVRFKVTPEAIFSNQIDILNVNFFNVSNLTKSSQDLSVTLAKWYIALRNVVLVLMLSVLAYMGLKLIISSSAQKKAEYKQMLTDWIVGIIIIFFMHYAMSFTMTIVESLSELLVSAAQTDAGIGITQQVRAQIAQELRIGQNTDAMGYIIIYLVLIMYTYMFFFKYLRRLLNMAFLTLISPIIAFEYAIDKIKDGKAQAFDQWIKEYVFNLLIQPMHLLLYSVLFGISVGLLEDNPIYSLVALGFLAESEKLVKKMFGFDKAQTANYGKFAAGAVAMNSLNAVIKGVQKRIGKQESIKESSVEGNEKIRMSQRTADSEDDNMQFLGNVDKFKEKTNTKNSEQESKKEEKDKEALNENKTKTNERMQNEKQTEKNQEQLNKNSKPRAIAGIAKKRAGKYARKLAVGGASAFGAASIGMIGIAAGLASDDYSNVFKYGTAALAGGAAAGKAVAGKAANTITGAKGKIENAKGKIKNEYYKNLYEDNPEEYNKEINKMKDKEFLKNKEAKQMYEEAFGTTNAAEAMKSALKYRARGITDDNTIIKAMNLKGAGEDRADERKIWAALAVTKANDLEKLEERLVKKGQSKQKSAQMVDLARKLKGEL